MTDKEKKKCKYMISILGEQILDDESDRIEVLTEGNFLMKKDHCLRTNASGHCRHDHRTTEQ